MKFMRNLFLTVFITAFFCVMLASCQSVSQDSAVKERMPQHVTLILGAFDDELALLEQNLAEKNEELFCNIRFVSGRLSGRDVVLAESGVGKVNAGMTTAIALNHFRPREIIFSGIAGGINPALNPGDIVIGEKVFQHDYGIINNEGFFMYGTRNPFTKQRNPAVFASNSRLVKTAKDSSQSIELETVQIEGNAYRPAIVVGAIATGDVFVASDSKKAELQKSGADAVEMEGGAVAQVCTEYGVDFIIIRSLSDTADKNAVTDIKLFYKTAANNSAKLVMELLRRME